MIACPRDHEIRTLILARPAPGNRRDRFPTAKLTLFILTHLNRDATGVQSRRVPTSGSPLHLLVSNYWSATGY